MLSPFREQVGLIVLLIGALLVMGAVGAKAAATYRLEASQFRALNHQVPKPSDERDLGLRDLELKLKDGVTVRGWFIPPRNGCAVVFVHGSPSDRSGLLPEARALSRSGYGAVLLDMPGHGESSGQATWGRSSRDAVRAAVDFLKAQSGIAHVGVFGFSMGSSIVARSAVDDPRIDAVVVTGAFTTIEDQLRYEYRSWNLLTVLPALWAAERSGLAMLDLRTIDFIAALAPRPLLIIGGTEDGAVPPSMPRALYAAAKGPKELWMIEGAGHGSYERVSGAAYFQRVQTFFDSAFKIPHG